jgi:hypothetical protein
MAYWAELDSENVVVNVIVVDDNHPVGDRGYSFLLETYGGKWVETSIDGSFRKNYAGIGHTYDQERDAFIAPKPGGEVLESYLDEETCRWIPVED